MGLSYRFIAWLVNLHSSRSSHDSLSLTTKFRKQLRPSKWHYPMLLAKGFRAVVLHRQSTRHMTLNAATNPPPQHDPRTRHGSPPSSDLPDTGTGRPPLHGSRLEPTLSCRRRPIRNITDVRLKVDSHLSGRPGPYGHSGPDTGQLAGTAKVEHPGPPGDFPAHPACGQCR